MALKSFYESSSGGDGWHLKAGWLMGGTFCSWTGITCESGDVTEIDLAGNGLQGIIHPSVFTGLKHLKIFNVQENRLLGGPIPREIGKATNLCLLEAYDCALNGTLPDVFDSLGHFNTDYCPQPKLDLHYNNLEGTLPSSIGGMGKLPYVSVANNNFEGPIPKSWGNLTDLKTLGIAYNHGINGTLVGTYVYLFM